MNPGEKTIHKQKIHLVRKYVSKLPGKYKKLIIYRYFDELSYKIQNTLSNFEFNEKELSILVKVLKEFALPIPYYSILKDGVSLSSIQKNHNNFNLTNLEFEKFIKKWEEEFTLLAKTILIRSNKMDEKNEL